MVTSFPNSQKSFSLFKKVLFPTSFRELMSVLRSLFRKNEYTNAVLEISDVFTDRFRFVPYHVDAIFHLSPSGFKWRRCLRIIHKKANDAIKRRRQELAEMERKGISTAKRGKYVDFLDILLQARVSYKVNHFFKSKV